MARKNHNKRTNLYDKAKNSRPTEAIGSKRKGYFATKNEGSGIFIMKPASVELGRDGETFVQNPGGTKWLPPQD